MILKNASVSQVDTYEMCERKWYLNKVLKIPVPQTSDTELGTQKHSEAEDYYVNGTLPTSNCVKKAIRLMPPRDPSHMIEQEFRIPTYFGGPVWLGYIDFIDRRKFPKEVTVTDWKTTGSLRWAKTPAELKRNFQLLSYGKAVSDLLGTIDVIKGTHCYMQIPKGKYKNPEDAMLVPAVVLEKEMIAERWEKSLISVKAMVTLAASEPKLENVKPNWGACKEFGGCPYKSNCAATKEVIPMGSFLDKLKGSTNGNGHAAVPPMAAPVPVIVAKPKPEITITIEEGVLPPDAPAPKLSTEIEAEKIAAAAAAKTEWENRQVGEADPAPKKRGRPAKGATVSSAATSEPSSGPGPSASVATAAVPSTGLQLYIDCLPTKPAGLPITSFEEWLAPIAASVAEAKGIEDYRLLTYGQGKVELAIAIRKQPVPSGIMVIPHMAPGAEEALSVLKPLASVVVQALR